MKSRVRSWHHVLYLQSSVSFHYVHASYQSKRSNQLPNYHNKVYLFCEDLLSLLGIHLLNLLGLFAEVLHHTTISDQISLQSLKMEGKTSFIS